MALAEIIMNSFSIHGAIVAPSFHRCGQDNKHLYCPRVAVWELVRAQAGVDGAEELLNCATDQPGREVNPLNEFSAFPGSIADEYPQLENKFVID